MDPQLLVAARTDLSLLAYGRRCVAVVWGTGAAALEPLVHAVNLYSPQRVRLELRRHAAHTDSPFWAVEMAYASAVHQTYFTFLMWTFSATADCWVHVWDAREHDALRRDFEAPAYVDCELSINRLWLRRQRVVLVNDGYAAENPHGEYVAELPLQQAMHSLQAGRYEPADALTAQLRREFSSADAQRHYLSSVVDVAGVAVPRRLAGVLSQHPHLIAVPDFDVLDAATVDVSPLCAYDLADEIPVTVAVANRAQMDATHLPGNLSAAQWVSVNIKHGLSQLADLAPCDASRFDSEYLLQKLSELGLATRGKADLVGFPAAPLDVDWSRPVCFLSDEELRQRAAVADSVENEEQSADAGKADFGGLDDTREFMEQLQKIPGNPFVAAAQNLSQALSEEDVRKTEGLEDFDDFVEFYAKNYMGYTEKDLAAHAGTPSEDVWAGYNDDSDYDSGPEAGRTESGAKRSLPEHL